MKFYLLHRDYLFDRVNSEVVQETTWKLLIGRLVLYTTLGALCNLELLNNGVISMYQAKWNAPIDFVYIRKSWSRFKLW